MKVLAPLRNALADDKLLGRALVGASWDGWKALLLACAGEELTDAERDHFTRLTGRDREPADGVLCEAFLCIGGRRGGKSKAMSVLMTWLATCCDWSDTLSLGERGRAIVVCPSMDQAHLVLDYVKALFADNELLASLVESEYADALHLKRQIIFEVVAASAAHSRGRTAIAICCDESAFLKSGDAVDSDTDVVTALRPSLATTCGPLLLTSSPAGAEGLVYQLFKKHHGPQGDVRCIVAKGATVDLNPSIKRSVIDRAYEDDAVTAQSEYGGEFREPSSAYLSRELIERAIEKGITERRPLPGITYFAYCDCASGTGRDSFTLCIGHRTREGDRDIVVIDSLRETKPPFNSVDVAAATCEHLRHWGCKGLTGDQYGKPFISLFAKLGFRYVVAPVNTSEVYLHSLVSWTSNAVVMLDGHGRAVDQLCSLRRKVGQAGRETVEHPKGANHHDDLAAVISGIIWKCTPIERGTGDNPAGDFLGVFSVPRTYGAGYANETDAAYATASGAHRRSGGGGAIW